MTLADRIVVLAWSLPDAFRQPRTSMSSEEPRKLSGFAWRWCATCDGTGETLDRFRRQAPCVVCGGEGRYEIDAYTDTRVATVASPATVAHVELVGCAWCQPSHGQEPRGRWGSLPRGTGVRLGDPDNRCAHCDGTGWRTLTTVGDEPGRERPRGELVAYAMHGDWPALARCLAGLRAGDRVAYRAFLAEAAQGAVHSENARRGLDALAHAMPSRIAVPAGVLAAWDAREHRAREWERARVGRLGVSGRKGRNQAIREARKRGASTADVAREYGVSERTARRVA